MQLAPAYTRGYGSNGFSRLKQADLVRHRGTYWAITEDTQRLRAAYDLHEATERAITEEQSPEPEGYSSVWNR